MTDTVDQRHNKGTEHSDHAYTVTPMTLADGRELIYFDDSPEVLRGTVSRLLTDSRPLTEAITESEIRQDPLSGEWVAYASHRMNRTFMPPAHADPLAPTTPGQEPTEIPSPDYDVVVFENRFPSFSMHTAGTPTPQGSGHSMSDRAPGHADSENTQAKEAGGAFTFDALDHGMVPRRPARARCEVICFTPDIDRSFKDLPVGRIRTVIEAWAHRTEALSAIPDVQHVYPFENRGEEIGVTLQHPHGQIYSYPEVPPRIQNIVESSKKYRHHHDRDLFDDFLTTELEEGTRIIARTDHFVVLVPAAAKWPLEVMVIPRRHVPDIAALTQRERADLAPLLKKLYTAVDMFFDGVRRTPYIASWNQAPTAQDARDDVRLHLQMFSLMRSPNRLKYLAGSESGIGFWINDTTPERIAKRFREIWGSQQ